MCVTERAETLYRTGEAPKPTLAFKNLPLKGVSLPLAGPHHTAHRLSRKRRRKVPRNERDTGTILPPRQTGLLGGAGGRGLRVDGTKRLFRSFLFHF